MYFPHRDENIVVCPLEYQFTNKDKGAAVKKYFHKSSFSKLGIDQQYIKMTFTESSKDLRSQLQMVEMDEEEIGNQMSF